MIRAIRPLAAMIFLIFGAFPALAEGPVPESRTTYEAGIDLVGTDLANIFDTTRQACEAACVNNARCEAFTFNQRSNSCFPKSDVTGTTRYDGAISGQIYRTDPAVLARAETRAAELSFLTENDLTDAYQFAQGDRNYHSLDDSRVTGPGTTALISDLAQDWLAYARYDRTKRYSNDRTAFRAIVTAYLRASEPELRRVILSEMADTLEDINRGRDMIPALRLAQQIRATEQTAAALDTAIGKYGFRVVNTQVESESATPRICAVFSENLIRIGTDYASFVQLPEPQLAVSVNDGQLCVDGVQHGNRYQIVLRPGLPAASGEVLSKPVELSFYVRDRGPSVRFSSRAYVLPRMGNLAIPIETVNTTEVQLMVSRIDDRNILRALQSGVMNRDSLNLGDDIGANIWEGTAQVEQDLNSDTLTRIPLDAALRDAPVGVYFASASLPDQEEWSEATSQLFVLSDIGIATYLGTDGLTVALRSLGDAAAMSDATVTLISYSNAVLAEVQSDADGIARFDAGLTRGTGGNAPALVTVTKGDDLTFLSLTDAAFDLSDRGVEGREASPPIDVFLATDRGAYRAGDTIHVTALMRDATTLALPGVPLTAILTRPDGVEYSRITGTADSAGGHVFALPTTGTAPRGTWTIAVAVDADAPPLATETVLVEDFLPERIDFDMALPDMIQLGDAPDLQIDARYLFGAPGADLEVEGDVLLRAASTLDGYAGYRFGQYDLGFDARRSQFEPAITDAEGLVTLPVTLPDVQASQPLELVATARVKEGSGRPVERQMTVPVLPDQPMIGIKPLFDGVVKEGAVARFDLIALSPDLTPADMQVQWAVNKVTTRYQWYSLNGRWRWEPTTTRTRIASGTAALGTGPVTVEGAVDWGMHEIVVEARGDNNAIASTDFRAGWYAPASLDDTPDLLEASLDAASYALGDTATFRIVPRYEGVAVVTVMSDRLITMKTVPVTEGENLIDLPVTDEWGAGAYVSASVIRPMDVEAGRNPARALGIGYAPVEPGNKALSVNIDAPEVMEPRGPMKIALQVDGVAAGETAYVTLAAVDLGILNLTGFESPDPQGHYFGQRKLGVELRDIYGRLIDGINGTMGTVRSGGDAGSPSSTQSPPPTEELVTFFTGPVTVDANGRAEVSFDIPAFNGTIRLMAIAWSQTGVGQAERDVIVRDPVVLTASLPRFLAPGDQSRMLLEIVHSDGPAGQVALNVQADGLALPAQVPGSFMLTEGGKQVFEVPVEALDTGVHSITVTLTTPDGRDLVKALTLPVVLNDPEVTRISRFDLAPGGTFVFDDNVFADMAAGTGRATLSAGPLARFDAPGMLNALDRYPYGCTEQVTSRALPLLYLDGVATAMGLATRDQIGERITQAIAEVTANQAANGAFGLWRPASGDLWLDAYVTDFLSRARAQGHAVPEVAFDNAINNLRNAVNYYPDFDTGGHDLAYALFVLAREGQVAVGDLRYYADQKADAFSSALARAQVGAALAQYGDQPRADAMFAKANASLLADFRRDERNLWRSDYGTYRRDAAAVLTLAVEAGSDAVDRDPILARISSHASRGSTQEAVWTLLAAHALVGDLRNVGLTIDGQVPDGPVVQLRDAQVEAAPVAVANTGTMPTPITVTTFGVPLLSEPAGGNGYAIEREYYTTEGAPVDVSSVTTGTRLVTVLTVRPFGRQEARLMVNDPLPAGFEIDNPNLLRGGDIAALEWLEPVAGENSEFRSDRFLAAVDWRSDEPFRLAYIVRAVSPGDFHQPAASVEDMYRPQMRAHTDTGRVTITP